MCRHGSVLFFQRLRVECRALNERARAPRRPKRLTINAYTSCALRSAFYIPHRTHIPVFFGCWRCAVCRVRTSGVRVFILCTSKNMLRLILRCIFNRLFAALGLAAAACSRATCDEYILVIFCSRLIADATDKRADCVGRNDRATRRRRIRHLHHHHQHRTPRTSFLLHHISRCHTKKTRSMPQGMRFLRVPRAARGGSDFGYSTHLIQSTIERERERRWRTLCYATQWAQ